MIRPFASRTAVALALLTGVWCTGAAQEFEQSYPLGAGGVYELTNDYGRITVVAAEETKSASLSAVSPDAIPRSEIIVNNEKGRSSVTVSPRSGSARIDLRVEVPVRSAVIMKSRDGEVRFSGDFREVRAETSAGTVVADIPLDNVRYKFLWTSSRPRIVSEAKLAEAEERNAGKSVIEGELNGGEGLEPIDLEIRTSRGIVLLNVDPTEVPSSLTERPLTEAAKSMIRSGDILLSEAIRRAAPKFFADYAATLPPRRTGPELVPASPERRLAGGNVKSVSLQVTDANNRALPGLGQADFVVTENGTEREIVSVQTTTAPFNLVLLLDVSGSVQNYVDFIRKAARSFVDTVDPGDRVAIIIFNDDVKKLSGFSTERMRLSESLDTFDAGGGTAYYDSIGYVLADVLEPLRGERCAVVVLTDGEDNRSFLSFPSLVGSLQESGALVYPLYVPIGVIARGASGAPDTAAIGARDPLRERFLSLTLTDKAQDEGRELARVSGGVYYPISRLSELQVAYNDIVRQLRTAYTIQFRSGNAGSGAPGRVRVRVKREGAFVRLGPADR